MTAGADFRAKFEATFEAPDLLYSTLLEAVVSALDLIEALEGDVEVHGRLITGARGNTTINPAIVELRHQRTALARLLGALDLGPEPSKASLAAKRAAEARWASP
jgi:hypothetical protein